MTVCQYFLQGRCSFGDRCRNEHPQNRPSGFGQSSTQSFGGGSQSTNRFGAFAGPSSTGGAFKQTTAFSAHATGTQGPGAKAQQPLTGELLRKSIEARPLWRFSVYGPVNGKPSLISGTDISPEEMQLEFKMAEAAGSVAACQQKYAQLAGEMDRKIRDVVDNADAVARQWQSQNGTAPAGQSGAGAQQGAFAGSGAFGQKPSAFGQSSGAFGGAGTSAFGQTLSLAAPGSAGTSAFGQSSTSSAFGQKASAFGQKPSAFGQSGSAFGQSSTSSVFGQPSIPSAFGQSGTSSSFGQSGATGAFGQPKTTSAFGQSNTSSAFGQSNTSSAFGQSNTSSAFGQPKTTNAFGQSGTSSAFGQTGASAFGNQGTSAFGQSTANTQSPFGQPNNSAGQISGTTDPTQELSAEDIERFQAPQFTMGQIPELAPTANLC
ncbi:Nucleoporin-like protein 2 [Coemansia erecta]|nr:Nucleoporin-like protein 2 [Coemansia erecta]